MLIKNSKPPLLIKPNITTYSHTLLVWEVDKISCRLSVISYEYAGLCSLPMAEWIAEMNDKGLDGQALVDAARSLVDSNTAK